jgi:hypothetical protein
MLNSADTLLYRARVSVVSCRVVRCVHTPHSKGLKPSQTDAPGGQDHFDARVGFARETPHVGVFAHRRHRLLVPSLLGRRLGLEDRQIGRDFRLVVRRGIEAQHTALRNRILASHTHTPHAPHN